MTDGDLLFGCLVQLLWIIVWIVVDIATGGNTPDIGGE